jgi:hypothetical protein
VRIVKVIASDVHNHHLTLVADNVDEIAVSLRIFFSGRNANRQSRFAMALNPFWRCYVRIVDELNVTRLDATGSHRIQEVSARAVSLQPFHNLRVKMNRMC